MALSRTMRLGDQHLQRLLVLVCKAPLIRCLRRVRLAVRPIPEARAGRELSARAALELTILVVVVVVPVVAF